MNEKVSAFPKEIPGDRLDCQAILGGIRNHDIEISAGKVIGSIYSAACCKGGKGGDIYYFGVCKGGVISRLAIADVTGHGEAVSEISHCVCDVLKAHMWEPDSRVILGEVNQRIIKYSLDAMTTAAVVAYYREKNEAKISYAGHPPILYKKVTDKVWTFAKVSRRKNNGDSRPLNLPLAVTADTSYKQLTIPITTGDRLFVYTDGIVDAPNTEGESFGLKRLKEVLDANANTSLSELKSAVLEALRLNTEDEPKHDDATMIVLEIS